MKRDNCRIFIYPPPPLGDIKGIKALFKFPPTNKKKDDDDEVIRDVARKSTDAHELTSTLRLYKTRVLN